MKRTDRKAAINAYRERKKEGGIYAVTCTGTRDVWVGQSLDVGTARNGLWFALRMGTYPNRELQACWKAQGGDSFRFEILESLDEKEDADSVALLLKERHAHWREKLAAGAV